MGMRTQILGQLRASGFIRSGGSGDIRDLNSNSEIWAVIKAALCAGSYPNIIRIDRDRQQLITQLVSDYFFICWYCNFSTLLHVFDSPQISVKKLIELNWSIHS